MNPALAVAALLTITAVPAVAQTTRPVVVDDKSGTVVQVTSVFSGVPPSGYAPVRVKAVNNLATDLPVSIDTSAQGGNAGRESHAMRSRFSFTAPAGKTTEREILVPLCLNASNSTYSYDRPELRATVRAGVREETVTFECAGYEELPFTAFSTGLAAKTIADLNTRMTGAGSGYRRGDEAFAVLFDPNLLMADWRAFSGLDVMAISSVEWTALASPAKTAVLQWVKLGGCLNLYFSGKNPGTPESLGITVQGEAATGPHFGGKASSLGMGRVCALTWDGAALAGEDATRYSADQNLRLEWVKRIGYTEGQLGTTRGLANPLLEALGEKSFAAWQVGIVLVLFGIIVGPFNLFVLAGKGRRHRLFFTTPIISLGAAVLLLAVIFLQDGTGGAGHRAALVYLDSGENSAFVRQMQVSRTGVLLGSSFALGDESVINMAVLPDSRWSRLKSRSGGYGRYSYGDGQQYSLAEKSCSGDWFQSRSEQAQVIDSVQSTRGRLELKPGSGGAPVITSTLQAPLEQVWYVDGAGKIWASPGPVTTGAEATLTEKTEAEFTRWRSAALSLVPHGYRPSMTSAGGREFFYAVSEDPRVGMVDTLSSIDWQTSRSFLFGPLKK